MDLNSLGVDEGANAVQIGSLRYSLLPVLFLLISLAKAVSGTPQPPPMGKLIDVGGYRVHLYCTGTGEPAVMIVGGGFSFDWGLVQPRITEFTRVCTYDASGTAWSDPFSASTARGPGLLVSPRAPLCAERVEEIHKLLRSAPVNGPYVLVGFSIGGLFAELYAARYPDDVAGMVIVDHAFIDPIGPARHAESSLSKTEVDSPPVLISESGIAFGIEDDRNFAKLPKLNQDLHLWAMSIDPVLPTAEEAAECIATVEKSTKNQPYPLGDMPLVVVSTGNEDQNYGKLQTKLLSLSHDSRQVIADNSSHMVIVDQPEVIVSAVHRVIKEVREHKNQPKIKTRRLKDRP